MRSLFILILTTLLLTPVTAFSQKTGPIAFGEALPEFILQAPSDLEQRNFLGIRGPTFTPSLIDAEVVLVELLDVHCPLCCIRVPLYNQLYAMLTAKQQSQERIKLLGIAVGNSREEVDDFITRQQVTYPVVADPLSAAADATKADTIPFTIVVRQSAPGQPGIVAGIQRTEELWPQEIFDQLQAVARQDPAQLRQEGERAATVRSAIESLCPREKLQYQVRTVMLQTGGRIEDFSAVELRSGRRVYTAVMRWEDRQERLFAEVVNQPAAHEGDRALHFIYAFSEAGKVLAFAFLQPNANGSEDEVEELRRQVVDRYLGTPLSFDTKSNAVPQQSRTLAIIHACLARGDALLEELHHKRLLGK